MVESGLKKGRLIIQAAIKATTQATQGGSISFGNHKKKEEVISLAWGQGELRKSLIVLTHQFRDKLAILDIITLMPLNIQYLHLCTRS